MWTAANKPLDDTAETCQIPPALPHRHGHEPHPSRQALPCRAACPPFAAAADRGVAERQEDRPLGDTYTMRIEELVDLAELGSAGDLAKCLQGALDFDINEIIQEGILAGLTLLGCAARMGNIDTLDYLINRGADLNLCDRDLFGEPPIHCAIRTGNLECIKRLLAAGADLDTKGWMDYSGMDRLKFFVHRNPSSGLDKWVV